MQYAGATLQRAARLLRARRAPPADGSPARRRPRRRCRTRRLAGGRRAGGAARRDAVHVRRGRRVVAAHPAGGLRRRARAGRSSAAQGLGGERRARLDDEPLLRHAQHDRRRRAARAATAWCTCVATRRDRRRAPGSGRPASRRGSRRCAPCSPAGATPAPGVRVREARRRRRRSRAPSRPTSSPLRARARAGSIRSGRREHLEHRVGDRPRVVRVEEPRRVADGLGQRRGVRARDRAAARHRLERRQAEAFVERREDERRRTLHQIDDLAPRQRGREPRRRPAARRSHRRR